MRNLLLLLALANILYFMWGRFTEEPPRLGRSIGRNRGECRRRARLRGTL
jgi:hypothetical protein